jgi:hypothetical protein
MPDEKKTYLINVESNLKEYADLAAEARKKVDELTIANLKLQASDEASTAEKEASRAALKNANDEYRKAQSLLKTAIANSQAETGSRKQLSLQLKLQEQALGKLGSAYIKNAQGMDILNPKYVEQRNQIAATKQKIIEYDLALKDGRSNIGRYGESVKTAFADAGKSMLSMLSPMALITAGIAVAKKIFDGFKEAIMSTSGAMNAMNIVGQVTKQMFYDLAVNGKLSAESMVAAAEAAKLMNEKRIGDRKSMVEYAVLEREIAKLEFDAADKTKTRAERQESLNTAIEKQNELSDKKIAGAKEDLKITRDLIILRPKDDKLRQEEAEIIAKIIKLDQERFDQSKRNQGKLTAFIQEETDAREKLFAAYMTEIEKMNEAIDKAELDRIKKADEQRQRESKSIGDYIQKSADAINQEVLTVNQRKDYKLNELQFNKDIAAKNARLVEDAVALSDWEAEQYQRNQDIKREAAVMGLSALASIVGEQTEIGKGFAVAAATIDTYGAAAKTLNDPTIPSVWLRIAMMASVILMGLANVKQILAVKVGKSSSSSASVPTSISSSIPAQRSFAAPSGSTLLTQPQLSQQQLNALPQQNLLSVDDIARALSQMPAPVVTVEDINAKTDQVRKVKVRADI